MKQDRLQFLKLQYPEVVNTKNILKFDLEIPNDLSISQYRFIMNDKSIKAFTEDSENLNDSNDLMQVADEIFNTNESESRSKSGTLTYNSIK
jgi:hypothetical protein